MWWFTNRARGIVRHHGEVGSQASPACASRESAQSATTLALCVLGLWVLFELARPLDRVRRVLGAAVLATATRTADETWARDRGADGLVRPGGGRGRGALSDQAPARTWP